MKSFIIMLVFLLSTTLTSAGELKWRKFDEGFAEAKKTNKKIMLDVYTDWCGWCKRLDKDVYANDKIMAYLNTKYISIKLNAESKNTITYKDTAYSEIQMARLLGVSGYPAIIFFESSSDPITMLGGYVAPEKFLPIIQYIGEDHYKNMTWEEFQKKSVAPEEKPKQ